MIDRYLKYSWEHSRGLVLVTTALTVLLSLFTFGRLGFDTNRESLFRSSQTEVRQKSEFEQRFGSWKDLVVVLDGVTAERRAETVEVLAQKLQDSSLATNVRAKVELPGIERMGLYYLSLEQLKEIDRALERFGPLLSQMSSDGWYGFLEYLAVHSEAQPAESESREKLSKVWRQAVEGRGAGRLDHLFARVDLPRHSYYLDGSNRHLIFVHSPDPLALKEWLDEIKPSLRFDGRLVLTGQPLLQAEERRDTLRDATISTVLALVIVQLLLVHGFRELARPRLGFLSLVFGLFWSVSWAALAVGSLNIITINFLAITVGLGVDFSIHILARYSEESENEADSRQAMGRTLRTTGVENLVGAVATSLAFWALAFTDFLAVQQLGVITGVAVPLCFLSVVLMLPPLLFWHEQRRSAKFPPFNYRSSDRMIGLEKWLRRSPRACLGAGALVVALMALVGTRVHFDYNLLNMQNSESEAVRFEKEGGFNSLVAFVVAESPAQARELEKKLTALPSVSQVQTVARLLPEEVEEKRPLVASIVKRANAIPLPSYDAARKPDWERMRPLAEAMKEAGAGSADWLRDLQNSGPGPVEDIWQQMQEQLKTDLTYTLERLQDQELDFSLEKWKMAAPDLEHLSNLDGVTLLRVRSKDSLWNRAVLTQFLDEIGSVTDRGIGPPFLIRSYLEQLRQSYYDAVGYAIFAIVVLLSLHFRAVVPTLIALVPKVVGAIGMFFAMACAGVELNPANCMALPLTLGIGLVFGIHAVHRCLESTDTLLAGGSTGKAIALSAWTTIASFGTLMAASHPGIFSLGFVMATGVAANMLATYLLVPPLVVVFGRYLPKARSQAAPEK